MERPPPGPLAPRPRHAREELARRHLLGPERERPLAPRRRQVVVVAVEPGAPQAEPQREGVQVVEGAVRGEMAPVGEGQACAGVLAQLVDQHGHAAPKCRARARRARYGRAAAGALEQVEHAAQLVGDQERPVDSPALNGTGRRRNSSSSPATRPPNTSGTSRPDLEPTLAQQLDLGGVARRVATTTWPGTRVRRTCAAAGWSRRAYSVARAPPTVPAHVLEAVRRRHEARHGHLVGPHRRRHEARDTDHLVRWRRRPPAHRPAARGSAAAVATAARDPHALAIVNRALQRLDSSSC